MRVSFCLPLGNNTELRDLTGLFTPKYGPHPGKCKACRCLSSDLQDFCRTEPFGRGERRESLPTPVSLMPMLGLEGRPAPNGQTLCRLALIVVSTSSNIAVVRRPVFVFWRLTW